MIKLSNLYIITLCFVLLGGNLNAQVSKGGMPVSLSENMRSEMEFVQFQFNEADIPPTTSQGLLKSLKFAHKHECSVDVLANGNMQIVNDKKVWRLGITSENARSLYLVFNNYQLPPSGELFIYTPNYSKIIGAFTKFNNKASGKLATIPLQGDSIILEYAISINEVAPGELVLGQVWHDYIGIVPGTSLLKDNRYGLSGDCNIDINCYEGTNWDKERQAVCRLIGGGQICTGSLLNNTRNDARPFFLTANHCINSQALVDDMVVVFNYESPHCNGPDGSVEQSISGGTLRATTHHLDFCLIELSVPPLPSYKPYFAGWNVEEAQAERSTVIHHPLGDVKKISEDFEPPTTANYDGGYDFDSHWLVKEWNLGTTEGGSSGSPMFNEAHQIVGTLTGGQANCDYLYNDYFSKMSMAWDEYSDSTDQLMFWLDPDSTGVTAMNGYDPYFGNHWPNVNIAVDNQVINVGEEPSFTDLSTGNATSWNWWFSGGTPNHSTEQHPKNIEYTYRGSFDVVLEVTNKYGTRSKVFSNYITVKDNCIDYNNLQSSEAYAEATSSDEWGAITGHNDQGFTEFAEKFIHKTGRVIYGVYIFPTQLYSASGFSTFNLMVWEGAGQPTTMRHLQTVNYSDLIVNEWNFIEFPQLVYTSGDFYVGYQIDNSHADTLAIANVPPRGLSGYNSCMVRKEGVWYQMNFFNQEHNTSLAIEPRVCKHTVGVDEENIVRSIDIRVFPNPADNYLSIDLDVPNTTQTQFTIVNSLGQVYIQTTVGLINRQTEIAIDHLPAGIYFIQVATNKFSETKRFIKL